MRNVLVTGGSGFIGKEIIKMLIKEGCAVRVLDLSPPKVEGVQYFAGSVLDQEEISEAMTGCDYVIHMAAVLGVSKSSYAPIECLDVNILGIRNVLRCCVTYNVSKILFSSSSEVYGEPEKIPIAEDAVLQPKSEYGVSKFASEEYLKAYRKQFGLKYTIVRYFNIYGEEQKHSWVIPKFVNNALLGNNLTIFGDGNQIRAFCHVQDAALGTARALFSENAECHVFNIGNSTQIITMKELAARIVKATGGNSKIEHVPLAQSDRTREREIFKRVPSTKKAKDLLQFEASINIDEGIKKMVEYKKTYFEEMKWEVEEAQRYEKMMGNHISKG